MTRTRVDYRHANWPEPPTTPAQALAHTVDVFEGVADDRQAVQATHSVYGPGMQTGLTMGDLRALQAELTELRKDAEVLRRLRAAGVDNWGGYSDALRDEDDE